MSRTSYKTQYARSDLQCVRVETVKKKLFIESKSKEEAIKNEENENYAITIENYAVCLGSNNLELENSTVIIESNASAPTDLNEKKNQYENLKENKNFHSTNSNPNKNTNRDNEITRKRNRNPENWQRNVLKKKREAGEEYINIKGKQCQAKKVKSACKVNCAYQCSTKFTLQERKEIKTAFYLLNDAQKNKFYKEFTLRVLKARTRTEAEESRRKYSYHYFFLKNEQIERVCQKFFCGTLDIAPKRIYYFYKQLHKHSLKIVPTPSKGKYIKKETAKNKIDEVIQHIKSFPTQESHFCRANSKRQYLDQNLSITKMHSLYVESNKEPVKENVYRKI